MHPSLSPSLGSHPDSDLDSDSDVNCDLVAVMLTVIWLLASNWDGSAPELRPECMVLSRQWQSVLLCIMSNISIIQVSDVQLLCSS